jgi:hypothetical protein
VARQGIAEAMHKTAEAITQCRFEATDPASDEVVLFKILQVLYQHWLRVSWHVLLRAKRNKLVVKTSTHALLHHMPTTTGSACTACTGAVGVRAVSWRRLPHQ